eukprot:scaffold29976_cov70-Phaeocystis_antarctica.AAC.2
MHTGKHSVRAREGLLERFQRRVALERLGDRRPTFWTKLVGRKVKHPERAQKRAHHGQHRRTIATELLREMELVAFHTSCAQEPGPKLDPILTAQLDHVRPEWAPLPRRRTVRQLMLSRANCANHKVLLEREAEQRQPVLRHTLAHDAQRLFGLGWQLSSRPTRKQREGSAIELRVAKVAHLRCARLEKRRLEQAGQVRHRGRRRHCTALLAIHALEHRLGCRLVQLDGDDHREHERVARDALLCRIIKGHALGIAQVLEELRVLALAEALSNHLLLLRLGQRLQSHVHKVLAELALFQTSWARRDEHDVALRREDLGHVPLDCVMRLATLVNAIQQHQRAARHQRLP